MLGSLGYAGWSQQIGILEPGGLKESRHGIVRVSDPDPDRLSSGVGCSSRLVQVAKMSSWNLVRIIYIPGKRK